MKNFTCILFFSIIIIGMISCRRTYECDCTTITTNSSGDSSRVAQTHISEKNLIKSKARKWCKGHVRNEDLNGQHISTECILIDQYSECERMD